MSQSFAVLIEQTRANVSDYVPDLPGCVATGDTQEQVIQHIREAIAFHLEGMAADAQSLPAIRLPLDPAPAG